MCVKVVVVLDASACTLITCASDSHSSVGMSIADSDHDDYSAPACATDFVSLTHQSCAVLNIDHDLVFSFTCHEHISTVDPTARLMVVTLSPDAVIVEWPTFIISDPVDYLC